jgi:hypothetical protein
MVEHEQHPWRKVVNETLGNARSNRASGAMKHFTPGPPMIDRSELSVKATSRGDLSLVEINSKHTKLSGTMENTDACHLLAAILTDPNLNFVSCELRMSPFIGTAQIADREEANRIKKATAGSLFA